ncbi:MAG: hypothetical protein H6659_19900 [Ardenticatenaceae bacterium]|nr:hypothetical protein [Anaerolineales bacterium]MCB8986102.1 hypothetical protein [Ardenticatenaceae bacterium]
MTNKLHELVLRLSTRRNFLILLAIFVGLNLFLAGPVSPFSRLQAMSGGASLLDLQFLYSPDEAYELLTAYGVNGRAFYLSVLAPIDLVTPLLMALFLAITLSMALQGAFPADSRWQKLALLPFVAMLGDYLENMAIVALMLAYPIRLDGVAVMAALFTAVKFIFTIASVGSIILASAIRLGQRERAPKAGTR